MSGSSSAMWSSTSWCVPAVRSLSNLRSVVRGISGLSVAKHCDARPSQALTRSPYPTAMKVAAGAGCPFGLLPTVFS